MKKFFGKNWKNILIVIAGIFLAIDLFFIVTTPATVAEDFLKYGPEVEHDIFDATGNFAGEVKDELEDSSSSGNSEENGLVNQMSQSTGVSPDLTKGILFFTVAIIVVLILSNIVDGSSSGGGKKK